MPKLKMRPEDKLKSDIAKNIYSEFEKIGLNRAAVKRTAFPSSSTGNRKLEHKQGDINITDLIHMSKLVGMSLVEFTANIFKPL